MRRERWVDFAWVMVLVPINLNLWAAVKACELPPGEFFVRFGIHVVVFAVLVGIPFALKRMLRV
jgi:hypothetical protein